MNYKGSCHAGALRSGERGIAGRGFMQLQYLPTQGH
jgi:hypothetical protein